MSRHCAVILSLCLVTAATTATAFAADEWKEVKGEHFIIYYLDDEAFANETLSRAEKYYNTIASDLGYSRYDNFWQWENRVKIYIYRTAEDFRNAMGITTEWPSGAAKYKEKEIITYKWSKGFFDSLLPHEITHLIFKDFVGIKGNVPLWLDEGVAQREEMRRRKEDIEMTRRFIKEKNYIPVVLLTQMDIRKESDTELVRKFYAEATSLVNYLIERYGGLKLTLFYQQLRDGKSLDEALSFVYTDSIHNQNDLEKGWLEYYGG